MNKRCLFALVGASVICLACNQNMTAEQKIAALENQRLEIIADLYRQQAGCQAQAIEFANMSNRESVVESCVDTHRLMVEASQRSIDNIDRRIAEINLERKQVAR